MPYVTPQAVLHGCGEAEGLLVVAFLRLQHIIRCSAPFSDKPAWLDQIVQVTATTNYENWPKDPIFEGYFQIKNQVEG